MINCIWAAMLALSFFSAMIKGDLASLCNAVTSGASEAVELAIGIAGIMAFWSGIMKIAEKSGLVEIIAKAFSPLIKFLFPDCKKNPAACGAIAMNMTANFFGMGNAATPFGIKAMQELAKANSSSSASNSMCMLAVVNSASVQLVPSTLIAIRTSLKSASPADITVPVWIASVITFAAGVIAAKIFEEKS